MPKSSATVSSARKAKGKKIAPSPKLPSTKHRSDIDTDSQRRIKPPEYKSFRLSKRIRSHRPQTKGSFRLFGTSLKLILKNWRLFGGVLLIYVTLSVIFVRGFAGNQSLQSVDSLLSSLAEMGDSGKLASALTVFGLLVGSTGSVQSDVAGLYQSTLMLIGGLAMIWGLRQVSAGVKVRVRDTFYKGMYPLIPFLIVILVLGLQLLPVVVANYLYGTVLATGLAASALEQVLWTMLLFLLVIWSAYMVTASIFALYIVTLPDMTPMKSLRSARNLVRHRRWTIMRKVLFLPLALMFTLSVVVGPAILFSTALADWLYFFVSTASLLVVHSYLYNLYRELIKDVGK